MKLIILIVHNLLASVVSNHLPSTTCQQPLASNHLSATMPPRKKKLPVNTQRLVFYLRSDARNTHMSSRKKIQMVTHSFLREERAKAAEAAKAVEIAKAAEAAKATEAAFKELLSGVFNNDNDNELMM